jgi:acetolactate synthase regulatory subunit
LTEFIDDTITPKQITSAIAVNLEVFHRLLDITRAGGAKLKSIHKQLASAAKAVKVDKTLNLSAVETNLKISQLEEELEAANRQIEAQAVAIEQYADSVQYYRRVVEDILNSKRWLLLEALRKPTTIKKYFHKQKPRSP